MKNFVTENRNKVLNFLRDGEMAVFFAGSPSKNIGDEYHPFTPNRNFFYLTAVSEPNIALALVNNKGTQKAVLFLVRPDEEKERWTGPVLKNKQAREITGIENILFTDAFQDFLADSFFTERITKIYLDMEKRTPAETSPALKLAAKIKTEYPHIETGNIYPYMADLRSIKAPIEIESIQKAIEITKKGIYAIMKNVKPNMYEYNAEAYFDFELKRNGVFQKAFTSIVASGINGTILHYSKNNSIIKENSLLLCDVGATYNNYSGDITRTFPVCGKFTPRQKDIYKIVLNGNYLIQSTIRQGVPFADLNKILKDYYYKELKNIGLVRLSEDVNKYYWHGVSHLLGLETHDAGRHNEGCLKAGMALTVEPGLYIAEEETGIRIEDDVLVTENGCENLSADIIKTPEDIEEFMK